MPGLKPGAGFSTIADAPTRTSALAPLGERVDRRGVFISRAETGEGVRPGAIRVAASLDSSEDIPKQFETLGRKRMKHRNEDATQFVDAWCRWSRVGPPHPHDRQ